MSSMMGGMMESGMQGLQKMMGGMMGGGAGEAGGLLGKVEAPMPAGVAGPGRAIDAPVDQKAQDAPVDQKAQDAGIKKKAAVDQTVEDVAKMQRLTQTSMSMSPFQDMSMYGEQHMVDPQQKAMMAQRNSKADELQRMLMKQYIGRGLI